jgi:hypothetical protein
MTRLAARCTILQTGLVNIFLAVQPFHFPVQLKRLLVGASFDKRGFFKLRRLVAFAARYILPLRFSRATICYLFIGESGRLIIKMF